MFRNLERGVIVLAIGSSRRAFRPALMQRILMIWLFRHFRTLPLHLLSRRQQKLIVEISAAAPAVPLLDVGGAVIGVIECAESAAKLPVRESIPPELAAYLQRLPYLQSAKRSAS